VQAGIFVFRASAQPFFGIFEECSGIGVLTNGHSGFIVNIEYPGNFRRKNGKNGFNSIDDGSAAGIRRRDGVVAVWPQHSLRRNCLSFLYPSNPLLAQRLQPGRRSTSTAMRPETSSGITARIKSIRPEFPRGSCQADMPAAEVVREKKDRLPRLRLKVATAKI